MTRNDDVPIRVVHAVYLCNHVVKLAVIQTNLTQTVEARSSLTHHQRTQISALLKEVNRLDVENLHWFMLRNDTVNLFREQDSNHVAVARTIFDPNAAMFVQTA